MKDCPDSGVQTPLFQGIEAADIAGLLDCLGARRIEYAEGDTILEEGSPVDAIGILLAGRGRAVKWDPSDRLIILTLLAPGSEIGAMVAAGGGRPCPVTIQALTDAAVLWLPFDRVMNRCARACVRHERLLRNYIRSIAEKGLVLHERIDCLLRPTIREKVLTYIGRLTCGQRDRPVTIPLDRQAMADYLHVERSALSRELSRMKRDGLLDYHRNSFKLLREPGTKDDGGPD